MSLICGLCKYHFILLSSVKIAENIRLNNKEKHVIRAQSVLSSR